MKRLSQYCTASFSIAVSSSGTFSFVVVPFLYLFHRFQSRNQYLVAFSLERLLSARQRLLFPFWETQSAAVFLLCHSCARSFHSLPKEVGLARIPPLVSPHPLHYRRRRTLRTALFATIVTLFKGVNSTCKLLRCADHTCRCGIIHSKLCAVNTEDLLWYAGTKNKNPNYTQLTEKIRRYAEVCRYKKKLVIKQYYLAYCPLVQTIYVCKRCCHNLWHLLWAIVHTQRSALWGIPCCKHGRLPTDRVGF